jgi:glycosyltransferase involved in cell wall biosynthesis
MSQLPISIVTPTFRRPQEVRELLQTLSRQTLLPSELILIDGAPAGEDATERLIRSAAGDHPFEIRYIRSGGGTAAQRNVGIEHAAGSFIALIDDDVRLEPDFLMNMMAVFAKDDDPRIGGVVGYRTNQHFKANDRARWRWYKRLKLLKVFEPGRYDFDCGYPINNNMQPPFSGTRPVDFMTTACAVWRREVFEEGLRFDPFFRDYGILEDAHFSLRAGRRWELLQCGDARCEELSSPNGRTERRTIGYKCVVNYYFVYQDIAGPLSPSQKFRFWRYQAFEFGRVAAGAILRWRGSDVYELLGRIDGTAALLRGRAFDRPRQTMEIPREVPIDRTATL